ncbi:hypothetical protein N0V85_006977 [Neurospora sp. IMI 360204]|nr:hypothetical protein N0V85_006977 [Neurospora sp. IMI 360204]
MTTPADLVPPAEGTLTTPQIDGIRIMRKTLLGSPSYDEVWQTLSMTSDASNLDVPSLLLWQEEGQKRRNALFYFIDEGEEVVWGDHAFVVGVMLWWCGVPGRVHWA